MQVITIKIKNDYLKGLTNIVFTLIIGQILVFSFDYNLLNKWTWLLIISSVMMYIGLSIQGFERGIIRGQKRAVKEYNKYINDINEWNIEDILDAVNSLSESIKFVNKNPNTSFWILKLGSLDKLKIISIVDLLHIIAHNTSIRRK